MAWFGSAWFGSGWLGLVQPGLVWFSLALFGLGWFGWVRLGLIGLLSFCGLDYCLKRTSDFREIDGWWQFLDMSL